MMDQQRSRAAATPTTQPTPPPPGQAAAPDPVVTGCLYEAGFSTRPGSAPPVHIRRAASPSPAASTTPGNAWPTC